MDSEIRKALNTERRKRFLENLISEAVINVLAEQQAPPVAPPVAQAPAPPAAPPPAAPAAVPADPAQPQAFTVDDMIERLNVVRGGRSFTDPEVYGQMVSWFKTLDDAQKDQLNNFLVELGKIVIDVSQEEPGNQPNQPQQSNTMPPAPPPPAAPAGGGVPPPAPAI